MYNGKFTTRPLANPGSYYIIDYYNQFKMPRGLGRKGITTEIDSQYTAELAAKKQRFENIIRTWPEQQEKERVMVPL
jgi:hypothetical protein